MLAPRPSRPPESHNPMVERWPRQMDDVRAFVPLWDTSGRCSLVLCVRWVLKDLEGICGCLELL